MGKFSEARFAAVTAPVTAPSDRNQALGLRRSLSRGRLSDWGVGILGMMVVLGGSVASEARGQAQTLDRVVAAIGKRAITESDLVQEYRLEKFLEDGRVPEDFPSSSVMEKLRDRLIDQDLLESEAAGSATKSDPFAQEARQRMQALEKKFPSARAFDAALQLLDLTPQQLLKHMTERQRILHLVDERLRPAAAIDSAEIQAYYQQTLLPELAREAQKPPPLAEVEPKIREILVQKKIDQLLAGWLSQLRSARHVELLPM